MKTTCQDWDALTVVLAIDLESVNENPVVRSDGVSEAVLGIFNPHITLILHSFHVCVRNVGSCISWHCIFSELNFYSPK